MERSGLDCASNRVVTPTQGNAGLGNLAILPFTRNSGRLPPVPLRFTCPACGQTQENISRRFLGKRVQCRCGQVVRLGPKLGGDSGVIRSPSGGVPAERQPASLSPIEERSVLPRAAQPDFAPPPETIERMFGKRPPRQRKLHQSPGLNPVGERDNPFRDGVDLPVEVEIDPAAQMSFPPLDVPVAVTPVVVALPYDVAPRPVGATAYLSLFGGILATAQGVLVSLLTMYLMLKLGALWSATSGDQLGLSDSMRSTIQNQLLIDLLLLGILLLINVGLAIAAGLMMTSSIFETRRETAAQPQPAINAGLVAGLYLVILLSLAILYSFTQQPATGGLLANYSRDSLFGSFSVVMISLASLSLLPTLLVNLAALRSRER